MDLLIVILAVGTALAYAGRGAWKLLRPRQNENCRCDAAGSGCAGCPVARDRATSVRGDDRP